MFDNSSDSEDDCYGNIASKLHKLKDNYQDDKLNTSELLNESGELDSLITKLASNEETTAVVSSAVKAPEAVKAPATVKTPAAVEVEEVILEIQDLNESSRLLDDIIKNHNPRRRLTRACTKKSKETVPLEVPTTAAISAPAAVAVPANSVVNTNTNTSSVTNTTTTSRGRRGRRSTGNCQTRRGNRGRRNRYNNYDSSIPTYSVGNTDEYPDMSDNVQLFSNNTQPAETDVEFIDMSQSIEDNEEMSVKVYWQSHEYVKFMIRKFQKIAQIFDYFAERENVNHNNLLFMYNDKILKPEDTPESIGYRISKFIEGGIVHQNVSELKISKKNESCENGVKVKFQCQNVKRPFEIFISLDEQFAQTMLKFSEHIEKPLEKLKFEFDGDRISGKSTPRELEFEGGECIDVKILS